MSESPSFSDDMALVQLTNVSSQDAVDDEDSEQWRHAQPSSDKRSESPELVVWDGPCRAFGIGPVFLQSKINLLLAFCPFALVAEFGNWSDGWTFLFSLLGLIPLAANLGFLTEEVAARTNQTLGGLLNATFGNATELIISIFALKHDLPCIIQESLLGSILSNSLLVLGSAFLLGGLRYHQQTFNKHMTVTSSGLLMLAVMGLLLPASLRAADADRSTDDLALSRFTAVLLLGVYCAYLYFQLKSHIDLFEEEDDDEEEGCILTLREAVAWLAIMTVLISVFSEFLVGAIKGASKDWNCPKIFIGVILIPIVGNAAEHATAVTAAYKNKMDLSLGVAIGSSTQIALFGVPFMVILAWMVGKPLSMYFHTFETVVVLASTIIVSFLTSDGKSTWISGLMLVVAYILVAAGFFSHKDVCE